MKITPILKYEEAFAHLIKLASDKELKNDDWLPRTDGTCEGLAIKEESFTLVARIFKENILPGFPYLYPNLEGFIQGEYTLDLSKKNITVKFLNDNTIRMRVFCHNSDIESYQHSSSYFYIEKENIYKEYNLNSSFVDDLSSLINVELLLRKELEANERQNISQVYIGEAIKSFCESDDPQILKEGYTILLNEHFKKTQIDTTNLRNYLYNTDLTNKDNKFVLLLDLLAQNGDNDAVPFLCDFINKEAISEDDIKLSLIMAISSVRLLKVNPIFTRDLVESVKKITLSSKVEKLSTKNKQQLLIASIYIIEFLGNLTDDCDFLIKLMFDKNPDFAIIEECLECINTYIQSYKIKPEQELKEKLYSILLYLIEKYFWNIGNNKVKIDAEKIIFSKSLFTLSLIDKDKFLSFLEKHFISILEEESSYMNSTLDACLANLDKKERDNFIKSEALKARKQWTTADKLQGLDYIIGFILDI